MATQGPGRGHPAPTIFPVTARARPVPYGVYDVTGNAGWVSVGTDKARILPSGFQSVGFEGRQSTPDQSPVFKIGSHFAPKIGHRER